MMGQVEPGTSRAATGQRHLVTILFTDLCGSTQLGRELEPEEFTQLVGKLCQLVEAETEKRGGQVVREQGDGALALFGYPRAAEDDGVRAAETALAVREQLPSLFGPGDPASGRLAVRSGIHCGICVISPGNERVGVVDVQGDPANTAAHIQQTAAPGSIRASLAALGPHGNMFDLKPAPREADLADEKVAGSRRKLPATLELVKVLDRRDVSRRYDATAQRGLTPLIGREDELAFLLQAVRGEARAPGCIVVQANAGLGKTRLLEEFVARADLAGWQVLRGSCESFGTAEVLQPFVQMVPGRTVPSRVDAMLAHFAAATQRGPVLMVVDDWQWADDASRQLLVALLEQPAGPRVVLAARPKEDGASWIAEAPHITLQPFDLAQTEAAVRRWIPWADPFLVDRIHGYAGGVPLFIEELCHSASGTLWESLEGRGSPRTWLTTLVASRLGLLTERQPELAAAVRAAAVIGNAVPLELLRIACSTPLSPGNLKALADADFLYPDDRPDTLRFKHGITRDAVYESIGLYERTTLHRRIQEALVERSREAQRAEDLEALANHARGAGQWEPAAEFAERAGDRALRAHAMDRARAQYHAALQALDRLPRTRETSLRWCHVAGQLGMTCIFDALSVGQYFRIFEQAVARARELDDAGALARAQYWLAYIRYGLGDFRGSIALAREALALAAASGDPRLAAQIEATLGQILTGACEYDEALAAMDKALSSKRQHSQAGAEKKAGERKDDERTAIGSAYTLACKGSVLADRGEFAPAHACFDEAMSLLAGSTHPVGTSVRNWIIVALIWEGRWQEALAIGVDSARIAENTRTLLLLAVSRTSMGFARWCAGEREGLAQMRDAMHWMEARGCRYYASLFNGWLCQVCVAEGERAEARRAAAVVLRSARQGDRVGEACASRAMAELAAREHRAGAAERWLRRAEASARQRRSAREDGLNRATRERVATLLAAS